MATFKEKQSWLAPTAWDRTLGKIIDLIVCDSRSYSWSLTRAPLSSSTPISFLSASVYIQDLSPIHRHTHTQACIAPVNMITPPTMNCWHRKRKSKKSSVIGSCSGAESVHSDNVLWWYSGTGICIRIINTGANTDARQHEPHHACHCLEVIYTFFILCFFVAGDAVQMPCWCSLFSAQAYLSQY